jgi:hypothetical protein
MQDWFLRKGYLKKEERLELRERISDSSIRQEGDHPSGESEERMSYKIYPLVSRNA